MWGCEGKEGRGRGGAFLVSGSLTTKKGAPHPRFFEKHTWCFCCALLLLLTAHSASFCGNLLAPDLAPNLSTPRAHWRQLPIKGRGLFHAYDVQIMKATLRSCQRFGTLSVGNLIAPDLAPSQSTPHYRITRLVTSLVTTILGCNTITSIVTRLQGCYKAVTLVTRLVTWLVTWLVTALQAL